MFQLLDRTEEPGILIDSLKAIYDGDLYLPPPPDNRPYIAFNFVKSLDGIISFMIPGQEGGGEISGFNRADQFVMGLLRCIFGNVMVGANAIRKQPNHLWTADHISPLHSKAFNVQRNVLDKSGKYRTFFVTGSGFIKPEIKPNQPPPPEMPAAFQDENVEAWIITTEQGRVRVIDDFPFLEKRVKSFGQNEEVYLLSAMTFLRQELGIEYLLVEGGARLAGSLMIEGLFDEFFLSTSPQIVGSNMEHPRLSFIEGVEFAPDNAPWLDLVSLKLDDLAGNMVLARYRRRME